MTRKVRGLWYCIFLSSCSDCLSVAKLPQAPQTNRFADALMDAASHYSGTLDLPTVIEAKSTPSRGIVGDLEDVAEEQFSDDEEEADQPSKLTLLDTKDTMSTFYKPVGEWAGLASQPIENTRVIKTLHGKCTLLIIL